MYDNTLGAILVAYGTGAFLFGVVSLQTAIYYQWALPIEYQIESR